jgi:acetyl-CoA carboxylase carboxyltransferase component
MDGKTNDHLQTLREMRGRAVLGGGQKRIEQQHARGKLTARERLALLLDAGSFQEFGALATHNVTAFGLDKQRFPGDGIVTGFGKISGRRVAVFAQDFTVLGGSFSEVQSQKISRIQDLALEAGIPLIGLNDSGGARIQEGVRSLAAYGEVFVRNVMASGVVPQISVILGPCAGGAVYSPALTDFVIMAGQSYMFLTGPDVIKAVTGEQVTAQDLGGAEVHTGRSGVAHLAPTTEEAGLELDQAPARLPAAEQQRGPAAPSARRPADAHGRGAQRADPDDENQPYDIRDAIDSGLRPRPASSKSSRSSRPTRWSASRGSTATRSASSPTSRRSCPARSTSTPATRFRASSAVRRLQHADHHLRRLPGLPAGDGQEYGGVIRHGAKIIYAYCEATVPKISIVTRKAMGGAYVAMGSKQMRTDLAFAWPTAQIAVMGAASRRCNVLFRDESRRRPIPQRAKPNCSPTTAKQFFNPYRAADVGQIDEVIEPRETRPRLAARWRCCAPRCSRTRQEARAVPRFSSTARRARRRGASLTRR